MSACVRQRHVGPGVMEHARNQVFIHVQELAAELHTAGGDTAVEKPIQRVGVFRFSCLRDGHPNIASIRIIVGRDHMNPVELRGVFADGDIAPQIRTHPIPEILIRILRQQCGSVLVKRNDLLLGVEDLEWISTVELEIHDHGRA